jgi:hypothetical protein
LTIAGIVEQTEIELITETEVDNVIIEGNISGVAVTK